MSTLTKREYMHLMNEWTNETLRPDQVEDVNALMTDYEKLNGFSRGQDVPQVDLWEEAQTFAGNVLASFLGLPGDLASLAGLENELTSEAISAHVGGDIQHDSWLMAQLFSPGPGELLGAAGVVGGIAKGGIRLDKVEATRSANHARMKERWVELSNERRGLTDEVMSAKWGDEVGVPQWPGQQAGTASSRLTYGSPEMREPREAILGRIAELNDEMRVIEREIGLERSKVAEGIASARKAPLTALGKAAYVEVPKKAPILGPHREGVFPASANLDVRHEGFRSAPPGRTPASEAGPSLMGPELGPQTQPLQKQVMRPPRAGSVRTGKAQPDFYNEDTGIYVRGPRGGEQDVLNVEANAVLAVDEGQFRTLLNERLEPWKAPLTHERSTAQVASRITAGRQGQIVGRQRPRVVEEQLGRKQMGPAGKAKIPLNIRLANEFDIEGVRVATDEDLRTLGIDPETYDGTAKVGLPEEVLQRRADSVTWTARFEDAQVWPADGMGPPPKSRYGRKLSDDEIKILEGAREGQVLSRAQRELHGPRITMETATERERFSPIQAANQLVLPTLRGTISGRNALNRFAWDKRIRAEYPAAIEKMKRHGRENLPSEAQYVEHRKKRLRKDERGEAIYPDDEYLKWDSGLGKALAQATKERQMAWSRLTKDEQLELTEDMVARGDWEKLHYYLGDMVFSTVRNKFARGRKWAPKPDRTASEAREIPPDWYMDAEDATNFIWEELLENGGAGLRDLLDPSKYTEAGASTLLVNHFKKRSINMMQEMTDETKMFLSPRLRIRSRTEAPTASTLRQHVERKAREYGEAEGLTGDELNKYVRDNTPTIERIENAVAYDEDPQAVFVRDEEGAALYDRLRAGPKQYEGDPATTGVYEGVEQRGLRQRIYDNTLEAATEAGTAKIKGPAVAPNRNSPLLAKIDDPSTAMVLDDIDEFAMNAIARLDPEVQAQYGEHLAAAYHEMVRRTYARKYFDPQGKGTSGFEDLYDMPGAETKLPGGERRRSIARGVLSEIGRGSDELRALNGAEQKAFERLWNNQIRPAIKEQFRVFRRTGVEVETKVMDRMVNDSFKRYRKVSSGLYDGASQRIATAAESFTAKEKLRAHILKLEKRLESATNPDARTALRAELARTERNLRTVESRVGQARVSRSSANVSDYNTLESQKQTRSVSGARSYTKDVENNTGKMPKAIGDVNAKWTDEEMQRLRKRLGKQLYIPNDGKYVKVPSGWMYDSLEGKWRRRGDLP